MLQSSKSWQPKIEAQQVINLIMPHSSQAHNQLIAEGRDVACLISRGMDPGFASPDCTSIQEEAIKCLQVCLLSSEVQEASTGTLTSTSITALGHV